MKCTTNNGVIYKCPEKLIPLSDNNINDPMHCLKWPGSSLHPSSRLLSVIKECWVSWHVVMKGTIKVNGRLSTNISRQPKSESLHNLKVVLHFVRPNFPFAEADQECGCVVCREMLCDMVARCSEYKGGAMWDVKVTIFIKYGKHIINASNTCQTSLLNISSYHGYLAFTRKSSVISLPLLFFSSWIAVLVILHVEILIIK